MKKSETAIWLSLATSPFLLVYIGLRSACEGLSQAGQASEEVFRGDRLPILNFPESDRQSQDEP